MSICKAIIDSYGGEIGFDSEEGKGSNFWVYIPCVIKFSDNTKKEKIESSNSDFIYNKKFNILIAEDNESNYKLISTILKNNNIIRACNGHEAVKLFNTKNFDIIFMDMRMPEMDGLEATKIIRTINPKVPIIAVTANAFDTDRILALEAGCNEFITKPLNHSKIKNILSQYDNH